MGSDIDVSEESLEIMSQGLPTLAVLMKKEGLLEFNYNGTATVKTEKLFLKAAACWLQIYQEYRKSYGAWRKTPVEVCHEMAELVVLELKNRPSV